MDKSLILKSISFLARHVSGNIYKQGSQLNQYAVKSIDDLAKIIDHFE